MSNITQQKLSQNFTECDLHIQRLEYAFARLEPTFPLSTEKYSLLTEDQISHLDQYLYRFSKLQDAMGRRLFRNLLTFLGEDIETLPFIDILNLMEKLQLLQNKEQWLYLRELRNEIAHEYGEDQKSLVSVLNELFNNKQTLITIYSTLKATWKTL